MCSDQSWSFFVSWKYKKWTWFENDTENAITANRSGCKGQNDLKIQEKVKVWWSNLDQVTSKIPGCIQGEDLQMQEVIVEEGDDDLHIYFKISGCIKQWSKDARQRKSMKEQFWSFTSKRSGCIERWESWEGRSPKPQGRQRQGSSPESDKNSWKYTR